MEQKNVTMYDIKAKASGADIELTQDTGSGEMNTIYLHRTQLETIARTFGTDFDSRRKLNILRERVEDLVCAVWFREELLERSAHGELMLSKLDAILDLAVEYTCGLEPEHEKECHASCCCEKSVSNDGGGNSLPPEPDADTSTLNAPLGSTLKEPQKKAIPASLFGEEI